MHGWIAGREGRLDTASGMPPVEAPGAGAPDDADLMLAYARGEAGAFEELYGRHKAPTYRYFLRHLRGRRHEADELHQDLWLRVIGARERYSRGARFTTWLYTLARHRLIDHWRASGARGFASLDDDDVRDRLDGPRLLDDPDPPLSAAIDAQSATRLRDALEATPPLQRDAFLLHVEAGLSLAEIAGLTGDGEETVKSRLRYAYRRLRAALEDLQ